MKELIINNQKQFDKIKENFEGKITIKDTTESLTVNRSFKKAYINVYDNATIKYVYGNATIESVSDNATIEYVSGNATIKSVSDNATIESVSDNATIKSVSDNATIKYVYGNATIKSVYDNATIKYVYGNATIESVYDNATIKYVYGNATIESVYGNATIKSVYDNATIKSVYDNATIKYVYDNATIKSVSDNATIESVSDNATIESVYDNATILIFGLACICFLYSAKKIVARGYNLIRQVGDKKIEMELSKTTNFVKIKDVSFRETPEFSLYEKMYPVETKGKKVIMYKAVRKVGERYLSDYNNDFEYKIGETKEQECSKNTNEVCSIGIHVSHLKWAYNFGRNWDNMAILEVEVDKKDIVVCKECDGKVRCSKIKVIRELDKTEY